MPHDLMAVWQEFRLGFRLADAFDVVVIAALLHAMLTWLRTTTSRRVLLGLAAMAALYLGARTFDLYLTSLVFHTAFAALVISVVVLFQEDIRRGFERMARWGVLRDRGPKTTALVRDVDTLVEASFALATRRTGALMVLQGHESLDRHINGGIPLAGRISAPLLYSIFDPHSAGHDGAVTIARDRIERFGVHLPISKNHAVIQGRGTRHSAALGLSELSDAFIIVASEERGVVSVAEAGRLVEMATAADLKGHLERFLETTFPEQGENGWQRVIREGLGLKALSVLIALLLWFVLASNLGTIQTSVLVPFEYRNVPEGARIDESTPAEALVTLSGTERAFRLLDRSALTISLDLRSVTEGTNTFQVTAHHVRVPQNVTVDRVHPAAIQVDLKGGPPAPDRR